MRQRYKPKPKISDKRIEEIVNKRVNEEVKKLSFNRNEDPWITDFKDWLTNW